MTPQEWGRLKDLFHGALDQPASTRRAWLIAAAGGDTFLLREAEALLDAHDTAGTFLEEPIAVEPGDLTQLVAPGARLGPYVVAHEIGRGGMGIVYLAEDTRLGRRVAIKLVAPALAGHAQFRERLQREARAAATITHPSVAVVYALEEIDGQALLVTEYIAGRTLRSEIDRGPILLPRALAIASDIAQALAAAHDAGVIHRDLKPDNVMLTAADGVKVLDFGIAYVEHAAAPHLTAEGALVGTPAYMAPEQVAGGRVDGRADIHAAGTLLFEMITGHHPLAAAASGVSIPAPVQLVIDRCLQHNPDGRYGSARELVRALDVAARQADPSNDITPPSSARWWWEFHQAVAALLYWLMVIPVWAARGVIGGWGGRTVFIAILASVVVAANLRLHLWFTSRFYPGELRWLRGRVARWIHAADWLFALTLLASGLLTGDEGSPLAILLLAFGLGAGVAFLFIEPATARAAFKKTP